MHVISLKKNSPATLSHYRVIKSIQNRKDRFKELKKKNSLEWWSETLQKKNKQTNHAQKKENQEAHLSCRPCGAKTRNLLRNFEKDRIRWKYIKVISHAEGH